MSDDEGYAPAAQMLICFIFPASVQENTDSDDRSHNTVHRRGFRVVAHFIGGKLSKSAQTIPDWAAKVFGKELHAAKQHAKPGRGR